MVIVFPFIASFVGKNFGFEGRCELTRINVQYSHIVNKVPVEQNYESRGDAELMMLRFETEELKRVAEKVFASRCSCSLYTLELHLLYDLGEDLVRFESISYTDARQFELFDALVKQSDRTASQRPSTRLQAIVQNTSSTVQNVRRA